MASTSVKRADIVLTGTLEEGENYFRTHRDDEFHTEMRPLLADRVHDVISARDAHELVEIGAWAYRDDRLMTDEHQRTQGLHACEPFLDGRDL